MAVVVRENQLNCATAAIGDGLPDRGAKPRSGPLLNASIAQGYLLPLSVEKIRKAIQP